MDNLVKYIPENTKGRDFVVGDLHGTIHLLQVLLEQVKFDPADDRLFSGGDLIDRGGTATALWPISASRGFMPSLVTMKKCCWIICSPKNHKDTTSLVAKKKTMPFWPMAESTGFRRIPFQNQWNKNFESFHL